MVGREQFHFINGINQKVYNQRERLVYDHIHKCYFDQEEYYRDIEPHEFGLYFLPTVLQLKLSCGHTERFLRIVRSLWVEVVVDGYGNLTDLHHAQLISHIIQSRELTEAGKLDYLFFHPLFVTKFPNENFHF